MMLTFITGLALGFASSFHCVGMCGPIALAVPVNRNNKLSHALSLIFYHLGKTTTYVLIGMASGVIGKIFYINGLQQILSILLGVIILLAVILPYFIAPQLYTPKFLQKAYQQLRQTFSEILSKRSLQAIFGIGLLNGLLPCGMVYMAAAGSAATGNLFNGAIFMVGFGLATAPALLALQVFGFFKNQGFRMLLRKSYPVILTSMAILLILRGLNLGIPYISPSIHHSSGVATCHSHFICKQ